jgi:hypothetical protein
LVSLDSSGVIYFGSIDMKDITAALLAIVFVLYSLIALLSVERNQDSTSSPLVSNQEKISELGLRVGFRR